jgi:hypothetical protein
MMGVISKMTTNKTYGQIIKEARISYLTSASTFSTKGEEDEFIAKAVIQAFCARNAEAVVINEPDYHHEAMGCGLEDRNITDRYEAMQHGWECAIQRMFDQIPDGPLFLAPQPQPLTSVADNCYIQNVPDHCDRIVWRDRYYMLPPPKSPPLPSEEEIKDNIRGHGYTTHNQSWEIAETVLAMINKERR